MKYTFDDVQRLITEKANQYGVDRDFFNRIIEIESEFNPFAVNHTSGARGLGQLMPVAITEYENFTGNRVYNVYDAEQNLDASAWYLGQRIPQMLRAYDQPVTRKNIAWAYNAGIGKQVDRVLPDETADYLQKLAGFIDVKKKYRVSDSIDGVTRVPSVYLSNLIGFWKVGKIKFSLP